MSGEWVIRATGADDARKLGVVGAATFLESFAGIISGDAIVEHCLLQNSPEKFAGYLADGACAWLAEAANGGAPIGFAMLTQPDLPGARDNDLELKRIYALSRFHGSGLGAALMNAAIDAASGAERLLLGVYQDNARAIAFYHKNGFEVVGERRFNVGGTHYDDLVLAKPLNS